MKHEATLRQIIMQPPVKLLSLALGRELAVRRSLSTDLIKVDDLHPDLVFEMEDDSILHAELHGYPMADFPARNLLYRALILRDHGRDPFQIVLWYGNGRVGIEAGLSSPPQLDYHYRLVDVREIDAEELLDGEPADAVFAILCRLRDPERTVPRILEKVLELPLEKREEALTQVLILSGLRRLEPVVRKEIRRMPLVIDIHENTFLQGIFEQGEEKGIGEGIEQGEAQALRGTLRDLLADRFGSIPTTAASQIANANADALRVWIRRVLRAQSIDEVIPPANS